MLRKEKKQMELVLPYVDLGEREKCFSSEMSNNVVQRADILKGQENTMSGWIVVEMRVSTKNDNNIK